MKFEDALQKLEKIVGEIEAGELTLDDSLKKYEDGVKLSAFCMKKLDEAEKKIEILQKGLDGKTGKKKFDEKDMSEKAGNVKTKTLSDPEKDEMTETDDENLLF